jgi:hypothetical protein
MVSSLVALGPSTPRTHRPVQPLVDGTLGINPAPLLWGLLSPGEGVPGGVTCAMETLVSRAPVIPGYPLLSTIPCGSNKWVTVRLQLGYSFGDGLRSG